MQQCSRNSTRNNQPSAIMNAGDKSSGSSNINFSLLQKGKSVFVRIGYVSISDMLLAKRAWLQVQQEQELEAEGDFTAAAGAAALSSETVPHPSAVIDGDSVSSDDILAALKLIKPPEWHNKSATLRLPDGHSNASLLLTAVIHKFESCIQKQLAAAKEEDAAAAPVASPPVHSGPSAAPQPASEQRQHRAFCLSDSTKIQSTKIPEMTEKSLRALPSVALPPGVTLKQLGAAEYYAELQCDRGTMIQIAGSRWRRMVEHLKPRAFVERWCKYAKVFQVRGQRGDVIHTVNMLHQEIQRLKTGFKTGACISEEFDIPHG